MIHLPLWVDKVTHLTKKLQRLHLTNTLFFLVFFVLVGSFLSMSYEEEVLLVLEHFVQFRCVRLETKQLHTIHLNRL